MSMQLLFLLLRTLTHSLNSFLLKIMVVVAVVRDGSIFNLCRQIINDPVIIQIPNLKCLPFHFKVAPRIKKNRKQNRTEPTHKMREKKGKNALQLVVMVVVQRLFIIKVMKKVREKNP